MKLNPFFQRMPYKWYNKIVMLNKKMVPTYLAEVQDITQKGSS